MADQKITELTNITGANIADTDEFVVVDASADETKAITASELRTAIGNGNFTVTGNLTVQGTTVTIDSASAQTVDLGDNDKIRLGDGDDLQIYHDGSNSFISDQGTGQLTLLGSNAIALNNAANTENMLVAFENGSIDLYYDNSKKLATTSTGIDVTGSISADGLTVDTNTLHVDATNNRVGIGTNSPSRTLTLVDATSDGSGGLLIQNYLPVIELDDASGGGTSTIIKHDGTNTIIENGGTERMRIDSSGNLLVGTTDNTVYNNSGSGTGINLQNFGNIAVARDGNDCMVLNRLNSDGAIANFAKDGTTVGSIGSTASGGGGIRITNQGTEFSILLNGGTASTSSVTYVQSNLSPYDDNYSNLGSSSQRWKDLYLSGTINKTAGSGTFAIETSGSSSVNLNASNSMKFTVGNTDSHQFINGTTTAMTLDSSGNLLVGRTSTSDTNVGGMIRPDGFVQSTRDGNIAADFNRNTSDGDIVRFSKGSSPVGSIGSVVGARLSVNSQSTAGYLGIGGANYYSWNADDFRPQTDNLYDLGDAVARFDDVYATNGTIQTSDRNEKQDIAELTDAEQRVAVAAKGLLRKFRWKDAVAEKGDEARTHFGIIAQDLQAAFAAEGLDAGDYAMFIHTTWTDEETGEERSRMGVRYSELLAFIIAAI